MQRVVGLGIDGTTVSISIGKTAIPCLKADYGDTLDPQFLSYMGSQEQDEQTPGTYKTDDLNLVMSSVVFRTLFMPALAANGGGNTPVPIVVTRTHPDLGSDSDLLENVRFKGIKAAVENSGKAEETPIAGSVRQIRWTDQRKTINRIAGAEQGEATF